jgi:hypothetical protein
MKERGKELRKESESRRKKERTKKESNEIMKEQVELPVLADTSLQNRHILQVHRTCRQQKRR